MGSYESALTDSAFLLPISFAAPEKERRRRTGKEETIQGGSRKVKQRQSRSCQFERVRSFGAKQIQSDSLQCTSAAYICEFVESPKACTSGVISCNYVST